jgi:hypothetical protein
MVFEKARLMQVRCRTHLEQETLDDGPAVSGIMRYNGPEIFYSVVGLQSANFIG